MAAEYEYELPLRTEAQLAHFIKIAFGIVIPDVQVCPTHSTPWRALTTARASAGSDSCSGRGSQTVMNGAVARRAQKSASASVVVIGVIPML